MTGHVDQLIGAYALNALDDVERATVERHLRTCQACADEAAELLETSARLGAAEAGKPPVDLRDRVLTAARSTPQRPRRPAAPSGFRRVLAGAAAVLVLAGAVGGTWWVQQRQVDREHARVVAAEQETARFQEILSAPDATVRVAEGVPTGRVTAVYSPSRGAAVFSFGGLGTTPPGKAYQLWRLDGETAVPLSTLPVGQDSGAVRVDHLQGNDGLAISVEDAGGAKQPTDVYARLLMS